MERFYFGSHVEIGLEWKRETSMKREEQDLYDCGNLDKTREAWSKAESMLIERS